ncbi:LOW QUALITY PROTEIN: uncharacterized protein LOC131394103, partial [Diceros bicornis minor]|uniref:LOW QUALITY PROTEIN: uncharacterized protein LOC131394103 n=1 Tax=Diceros bicornis minor TaxID=77932 RepID=UPI0026EA22F4
PCRSPWNTPLLPVKKPGTADYRPVQDLREVNKRVQDLHPTVPNPYNLLSSLPPSRKWYTVLDLKDAFFCLRLHPKSQLLFAFEWRDPDMGIAGQLTWTRLPQGFKNSPTLFDEALHRDLTDCRVKNPQVTLLQYVDDLLLAAETPGDCEEGTKRLLAELGELGYRASKKKAQLCQEKVVYLGYTLKDGQRWLTDARKKTVTQIPAPTSARQVREFLGTAGFCRLWIPGFATLAAPLYPLTKESGNFVWTLEHQKAFETLKRALLEAPALALPDLTKPFTLYVDEKKEIARGVLTQALGPWKRPVAYLSKKLDPVASGWPSCLRAIAATAQLVKDADKLTLGQQITIVAPHALASIIRQPPDRWMTNARMTHYQSLLLTERITFAPPAILNPATLLPEADDRVPVHQCGDILASETGIRPDLPDEPWAGAPNWYTDGSSFLAEEGREYLSHLHRLTHLSPQKLIEIIQASPYQVPDLKKTAEEVYKNCRACALTDAAVSKCSTGHRLRGNRPGAFWEIDFTEIRPARYGNKYLLVFVDTFSGWVEAFPTRKETASVVAKKILEEILPRFGIPKVIGSDNGPAFVAQVSQGLASQLGINWKLHCAYRPQSSGQVERMNRTIKETLTKLSIETGDSDWTALLPFALFRVRNTPQGPLKLTPFEILYGTPPPLAQIGIHDPDIIPSIPLSARLKALEAVRRDIWHQLKEAYQPGDLLIPHQFQVGDSVLVRRHRTGSLEPRWKGPYVVLLTTPTAVKVDGITSWVHATHVKKAPQNAADLWKVEKTDNPLKLRLRHGNGKQVVQS